VRFPTVKVFNSKEIESSRNNLSVYGKEIPSMFTPRKDVFIRIFTSKGPEPTSVLSIVFLIVSELIDKITCWIENGNSTASG
jgi:hypothetical protein